MLFGDSEFRTAFRLSFWIAGASAIGSLVLSLLFIGGRVRGSMAQLTGLLTGLLAALPAGISPLVFCLGFLLFYSSSSAVLGVAWLDPFEGSAVAIVIIHSILFLPMGLRFLLPIAEEARHRARRDSVAVARSLGASAWKSAWLLEWPHWRRGVLRLLRLAWVASFMDVAVSGFFSSENLVTLPILATRWMSRYAFGAADAILFSLTAVAVLVLYEPRGRNV